MALKKFYTTNPIFVPFAIISVLSDNNENNC